MKQKRLKPDARKEDILAAALPLAEYEGYTNLTREQVGTAAGVSGPILNYYWGTMNQFRRALMCYAVQVECLEVVAQGVISGEANLEEGDPLRRRALDSLR